MAKPSADQTITTSIRINGEIWIQGKHRALDLGKPIGKYIEDLIKADTKTK